MVTITLTFRVYNRNFFNSHIVWHIIEKNIYEITFIYLIHVLSVVYKTRIYKWSNRNFPIWSVKVAVKFLITAFFFSCECFKETLQLILRKIHKMRFFPWLSVFLLHRWKYKLSENNAIFKMKITVFFTHINSFLRFSQ